MRWQAHVFRVVTSFDPYNLQRFLDAQAGVFEKALTQLRRGSKQSHWMWFIFPQLSELGRSQTSKFFGLASIDEAIAYLEHRLLGSRLRTCVDAILQWSDERTAQQIFGAIDAKKLHSSLTLFDRVESAGLFDKALLNFFQGHRDELSLALLDRPH